MAKITISPDCGNAPRKLFLKTFHETIANGQPDDLRNSVSTSAEFSIAGEEKVVGNENIVKRIQHSPLWKVKELKVETIITHGPDASVSG